MVNFFYFGKLLFLQKHLNHIEKMEKYGNLKREFLLINFPFIKIELGENIIN